MIRICEVGRRAPRVRRIRRYRRGFRNTARRRWGAIVSTKTRRTIRRRAGRRRIRGLGVRKGSARGEHEPGTRETASVTTEVEHPRASTIATMTPLSFDNTDAHFCLPHHVPVHPRVTVPPAASPSAQACSRSIPAPTCRRPAPCPPHHARAALPLLLAGRGRGSSAKRWTPFLESPAGAADQHPPAGRRPVDV